MQKVIVLLFRAVPHRRGDRYPQRGLPRELGAIGPLQLVMLHWDKAHPARPKAGLQTDTQPDSVQWGCSISMVCNRLVWQRMAERARDEDAQISFFALHVSPSSSV